MEDATLNDAIDQADPNYRFARLAVDKAKLCPIDADAPNPFPRVAIVIARGDVILGWAAKGVGGECIMNGGTTQSFSASNQDHAEQSLLAQLHSRKFDLKGAVAYITLEPCTKRRKGTPCADLLVEAGIGVVYIGNCDPNPNVGALAWKRFHSANITVRDFAGDLRNESRRDNTAFFKKFEWSGKITDGALFDYEANGGERTLGPAGAEFRTRWTNRANGSIWALDYGHNVCLAKNCSEFDQVDDPGRWLEDSHYTKPVNEGEIVVFQNEHGFALVKVLQVTTRTTTANAKLHIRFELRYL